MTTVGRTVPARFASVMAAGLGLFLILGGEQRVSGPSYFTIANYGGPYAWGGAFLVAGAVMIFATTRRTRMLRWSYWISGVAYLFLAGAAAYSAYKIPTAGITGIWTYTVLSVVHAYLGEKT